MHTQRIHAITMSKDNDLLSLITDCKERIWVDRRGGVYYQIVSLLTVSILEYKFLQSCLIVENREMHMLISCPKPHRVPLGMGAMVLTACLSVSCAEGSGGLTRGAGC